MLPVTELLELYRAEKLALDDPFEPFCSFAEWKEDYTKEYKKTHRTVDIRVAMEEADRAVKQADIELDQHSEGDDNMSETKVLSAEEQAKRDAKNAKRREARAASKTSTKSVTVRAARAGTKAEAAAKIFGKMYPTHPRADIVAKFQSQASLSKAGASTYYQKLLTKAKV